jgi:apolipoprotein N-acyltransferase
VFWQLAGWSVATSLLLYACYFPLAWGILAWVALVPLCHLIRSEARTRTIFFAGWIGGLIFFFPALQWMRVADTRMYYTWILLATYCSLYFPVGIFLIRALDRRHVPLVLSLPVVWTALELLRAHLMGGFAWYFLSHTQHDFLPIIQVSDVTGAYGVSFLIAMVNAVAFEWLWVYSRPAAGVRRPVLVFQSAVVLLMFAGCLLYGCVRINGANFRTGPKLALIQGNVDQRIRTERNDPDEEIRRRAIEQLQADYDRLGDLARREKPDLVIYPETSFGTEWLSIVAEDPSKLHEKHLEAIKDANVTTREVARDHEFQGNRPYVILGLNTTEYYPGRQPPRARFNSALLIGPGGDMLGRYDKMHRVPFGEYVPLREAFPFMNRFAPYDYDYSIAAGREQTRLPVGDHRFGVLICYEDTDTVLARGYVDPREPRNADFLVNISNDGWFNGTEEHEQHLAICRLRAVEARRSIARSVNMGISAVVDGNGRVLAPGRTERTVGAILWEIDEKPEALGVGQWSDFKKESGILFASVPIDGRGSLYARFGDWLPHACWATLLLCLILLRKRSPRVTAPYRTTP